MKSRKKVISQKHIKEIPPFCDNPLSAEAVQLQHDIASGKIAGFVPNRRQRKAMLRAPKKTGRVRH